MEKLKTIICGIDFSESSRCALRQAARIARWDGARLLVVHVIEMSLWEFFPEAPADDLEASATAKLDRFVAETLGDPGGVEQRVIAGHPFRSLDDLVASDACDLLVLGVHGHGATLGAGSPAGTLARRCVRKIPSKILLVRGDQPDGFKSVVHCTDFSATAARAFEQAIAVARRERAKLKILHATIKPERIAYGMADAQLFKMLKAKTLRIRVKLEMEKYISAFASELEGIDVETTIVEAGDSTGAALLESIRESRADLVVLGSHGRGAIASMLIGTTAEKIVSQAPCSVLTIKPENSNAY